MKEKLIRIFKAGLEGEGTHVGPLNALKGLNSDMVRKNPGNNFHSCIEILHHIVVWQDAVIKAAKGEEVDWAEIEKNQNWPNQDLISDDTYFPKIQDQFLSGLKEMNILIENISFDTPAPPKRNIPDVHSIMILLQHNSYHLGQLNAVRKILGIWN